MEERENRDGRWLRFHAIAAPIGVAAVTALLAWLGQSADENQSATVRYLNSAGGKAYLATVTYALVAVILEGVGRMVFWAWSEHKKAQKRFKDVGRAEAAKEYEAKLAAARGREREREDALAAARGREREREDALTAARERARADGIDLDKYLNP